MGRFFVDVTFSEEGEFLPPSYLEAARDPKFKESLICLGCQEPGADRNAEAGAKAEPDQETRTAKEPDLEHGTSSQPYPQTGTYRYWFQYAGERAPEVIYVKRPRYTFSGKWSRFPQSFQMNFRCRWNMETAQAGLT